MKRDVLVAGGGMLAVGVVIWAIWGNPEHAPHMHAVQKIPVAPELKLVTAQSPYMRSER